MLTWATTPVTVTCLPILAAAWAAPMVRGMAFVSSARLWMAAAVRQSAAVRIASNFIGPDRMRQSRTRFKGEVATVRGKSKIANGPVTYHACSRMAVGSALALWSGRAEGVVGELLSPDSQGARPGGGGRDRRPVPARAREHRRREPSSRRSGGDTGAGRSPTRVVSRQSTWRPCARSVFRPGSIREAGPSFGPARPGRPRRVRYWRGGGERGRPHVALRQSFRLADADALLKTGSG